MAARALSPAKRVLQALARTAEPRTLTQMRAELVDVSPRSVASHLASLTARAHAIREGAGESATYVLGPKGRLYLDTFGPPG